MSQKLENARNLYLDGIRDGNYEAAMNKYTGDRYTQHSTGVPDGKSGFISFFKDFVKRNPVRDIKIVRGFEDGQYVFVHVLQTLNNGEAQWVTADLFDTGSDDKIVEHWDVIEAYRAKTPSGHTSIDGVADVTDLDKTDANKSLIENFFSEVYIGRDSSKAAKYFANDYIEHSENSSDGVESVTAYIASGVSREGFKASLFRLVGSGNFVVTYSKISVGDEEHAIMDIYRLREGLICEHWHVAEVILPKSQWSNSGKF